MKTISFCILSSLFSLCLSANKDRWDTYREGWSPLMLSIYHHQMDSVKKLIADGADVNYAEVGGVDSDFRISVLDIAVKVQNEECVKILLATNKVKDPEKSLFSACADSSLAIMELLIKYGASPNYANKNAYSALIMATNFGSIEIVQFLLDHGAEINHPRSGGKTPLIFAAFNGQIDKVRLLLSRGADKNVRDDKGKRAYDYVDEIYDRYNINQQTKAELRELLK